MPDIRNGYEASPIDFFTGLGGMTADANLLIGRQSAELNNMTLRALDYLISGKILTGTVTSGSIEVWALAAFDTTGTIYPDVITNAGETAKTWSAANVKASAAQLVRSFAAPSVSGAYTFSFSGVSLAGVFGGTLPPRVVFFVTHSCNAALNATSANHFLRAQPVFRTVS